MYVYTYELVSIITCMQEKCRDNHTHKHTYIYVYIIYKLKTINTFKDIQTFLKIYIERDVDKHKKIFMYICIHSNLTLKNQIYYMCPQCMMYFKWAVEKYGKFSILSIEIYNLLWLETGLST